VIAPVLAASLAAAGVGSVAAFPTPAAKELPVTGRADARLAPFDRLMAEFVREHKPPGASLAVTYHGRLVYARGFGYADVEAKEPVRPASLFRIASVSKPLTAVAVLQLVEAKKLKLSDRVVDLVPLPPHLAAGAKPDPRWKDITVLQLLQHTGGFDRDKSFDPMFRPVKIAKEVGVPPPAGPEAVIRYMRGLPLDFTPGERYAYSNFGYCLLGRVVEKAGGQPYEAYVREQILKRVGVRDMRVGHTLRGQRAEGEVTYYDSKGRTARAVVGPPGEVPLPYGAWCLEAMDSHGGWVASASDLVRFAAALDRPARSPLLRPASIQAMFARPAGAAGHDKQGRPAAAYYGCGWDVRPVPGSTQNTWHGGSLDGTSTLLVRRHDGIDWAVLFNADAGPAGKAPADLIDGKLHDAADAIKAWPEYDLFRTTR
jgi:N-acyl-D-amino-acid deacylase